MVDMALCENKQCPRRHECFRYMSIPDPYWNYFSEFDHENCKDFIEIRDRPIVKNKLKEKENE
jgi:hypothetical protein